MIAASDADGVRGCLVDDVDAVSEHLNFVLPPGLRCGVTPVNPRKLVQNPLFDRRFEQVSVPLHRALVIRWAMLGACCGGNCFTLYDPICANANFTPIAPVLSLTTRRYWRGFDGQAKAAGFDPAAESDNRSIHASLKPIRQAE